MMGFAAVALVLGCAYGLPSEDLEKPHKVGPRGAVYLRESPEGHAFCQITGFQFTSVPSKPSPCRSAT